MRRDFFRVVDESASASDGSSQSRSLFSSFVRAMKVDESSKSLARITAASASASLAADFCDDGAGSGRAVLSGK